MKLLSLLLAIVLSVCALPPAQAVDHSKANLATALRFANEGLGKANMQVFDELLDPNIVVTTGLSPQGPIRGREAYKKVFGCLACDAIQHRRELCRWRQSRGAFHGHHRLQERLLRRESQ